MARHLKTGWVIIATSGVVVDESGRKIKKEWLSGAAKNYNPRVHTAKIWPEHDRDGWNGGKVLALKTQAATEPDLKGEIHLKGILAPNNHLMAANENGQLVSPSVEIEENFMAGKYKYYLGGLGMTDDQASAGVQEMFFSAQGKPTKKRKAKRRQLRFKAKPVDLLKSLERSFLYRLFHGQEAPTKPETGTRPMDKKQFKALKTQVAASNKKNAKQFKALATSIKAALAGAKKTGTGGNKNADKNAQQFKAGLVSVRKAMAKQAKQFKKLMKQAAHSTQAGENSGDESDMVV